MKNRITALFAGIALVLGGLVATTAVAAPASAGTNTTLCYTGTHNTPISVYSGTSSSLIYPSNNSCQKGNITKVCAPATRQAIMNNVILNKGTCRTTPLNIKYTIRLL